MVEKKKVIKIILITLVVTIVISAITLIIIGLIPGGNLHNSGSSCIEDSCTIG